MYIKFFYVIIFFIISGCAGVMTPSISEKQIAEINQSLINEHNSLVEKIKNNMHEEWIQPINKKELCKVYMLNIGDSKNKQVAWDGECKNGYAYGLGREFITGNLIDQEWLAYYDGSNKPTYFYVKDNLNNSTFVGKDVGIKRAGLITHIIDDGIKFDYIAMSIYSDGFDKNIFIINSPIHDGIRYIMDYKNFSYTYDVGKNNMSKIVFIFRFITKDKHEFAYIKFRNGITKSFELINNTIKEIKLPQSFIDNINKVYDEIISKKGYIDSSYREGLMAKEQYKQRVKSSPSVNFMPQDKYLAILNENHDNELVKQKISNVLKLKQEQHKLNVQIKTQEAMASAAITSAKAAQNQADAINRLNHQSFINNMNMQGQLQNLNNNLFLMRMGY